VFGCAALIPISVVTDSAQASLIPCLFMSPLFFCFGLVCCVLNAVNIVLHALFFAAKRLICHYYALLCLAYVVIVIVTHTAAGAATMVSIA
jgi:hypothetical protein